MKKWIRKAWVIFWLIPATLFAYLLVLCALCGGGREVAAGYARDVGVPWFE